MSGFLVCLFLESDKLILKFIWKYKGCRMAKTILIRKYRVGGLTLATFKAYYKVTNWVLV